MIYSLLIFAALVVIHWGTHNNRAPLPSPLPKSWGERGSVSLSKPKLHLIYASSVCTDKVSVQRSLDPCLYRRNFQTSPRLKSSSLYEYRHCVFVSMSDSLSGGWGRLFVIASLGPCTKVGWGARVGLIFWLSPKAGLLISNCYRT